MMPHQSLLMWKSGHTTQPCTGTIQSHTSHLGDFWWFVGPPSRSVWASWGKAFHWWLEIKLQVCRCFGFPQLCSQGNWSDYLLKWGVWYDAFTVFNKSIVLWVEYVTVFTIHSRYLLTSCSTISTLVQFWRMKLALWKYFFKGVNGGLLNIS